MEKGQIVRRYLAHLGIILCHLSIVGVVFIVGSFIAGLLSIFAFLLGLILIVFTIGTIFVMVPNYWDKVMWTVDATNNIVNTSISLVPTVAVLTAIFCVASIVLTALDARWEKARIRLIISSVMCGVVVGLLVVIIAGIAGGAA